MPDRLQASILLFILLFLSPYVSRGSGTGTDEYWMSIRSDGGRIGYSYSSLTESEGVFTEAVSKTKLKVKLLGSVQEIETEAEYRIDGYKVLSFSFVFNSPGGVMRSRGLREGDEFKMKIRSLSGETELVFPAEGELIPPSLIPVWLAAQSPETGREYRTRVLDPLSIIMGSGPKDIESVHKITGREKIDIPGLGSFDTLRVESEMLNSRITTWMTDKGEVVKQAVPPGMISLRDTEENILKGGYSDWDIGVAASITPEGKLTNARGLKYLKVELDGIEGEEGFDFRDGYRQSGDGRFVEIHARDLSKIKPYDLPYNGNEHAGYLEPDSLIQSGDDGIILRAELILGGEKDALKAASRINDWVYRNLEKEGTASIPSALDVLRSGKGDCNEHSALFAALARASGIPTKTVSGTMYNDGRFYYHAWNEVFVGEWVAVDPTFGQFPADAAHIKFIEGDLTKSSRIINLVGKIKLKILDAS